MTMEHSEYPKNKIGVIGGRLNESLMAEIALVFSKFDTDDIIFLDSLSDAPMEMIDSGRIIIIEEPKISNEELIKNIVKEFEESLKPLDNFPGMTLVTKNPPKETNEPFYRGLKKYKKKYR